MLPTKTLPWRLFSPEDGAAAGAVQTPAAKGKKETGNLHGQSKQEDPGESARERYRKHAESLVSMSHLAVKSDGSLKIDEECIGDLLPQSKIERWKQAKNIVAVASDLGVFAILKADGRVEAYCRNREDMETQVDQWRNVKKITVIGEQLIGIHEDGTISVTAQLWDYDTVVTKYVQYWKNVVSVSTVAMAYDFDNIMIAGLCRDGTVVAADGSGELELSGWKQMVQVKVIYDRSDLRFSVAGLRRDGKVLLSGNGYAVDDWKDIVQIAGGDRHFVGLRKDGTVVAAGDNDAGQGNVRYWRNMLSVVCGGDRTVGLRKDGTVAVTGAEIREHGWKNIPAWKDIIAVLSDGYRVCGIRQDGTLIYTDFTVEQIRSADETGGYADVPPAGKNIALEAVLRKTCRFCREALRICRFCDGSGTGWYNEATTETTRLRRKTDDKKEEAACWMDFLIYWNRMRIWKKWRILFTIPQDRTGRMGMRRQAM